MSFKGRTYNDTWGGRKTATDLIDNPVDILEHIKRLQNFSGPNSPNAGKQYDANALICTAGAGSFDSAALQATGISDASGYAGGLWSPGDLRPARQVFGGAWTDNLSTELCNTFFLLSYQNQIGEECVSYLFDDTESVDEITFGDIVGNVGEMIEPSSADIFCEPVINYAYDQATGKYSKQLRISNVGASSWDAAYTPGYSGTDGQETWNLCRQLWLRTKQLEPMPDSIANRPWIARYEDAVWYLRKLAEWMGKRRVEFTVTYSKAKSWEIGKKIKLKLPHQTDNISISCLVEEIRKRKQNGTVKIKVVLLTDIPTTFFFE